MERLKKFPLILFILIVITLLIAVIYRASNLGLLPVSARFTTAEQSNCQYPTRPLNPDGSCDNSDPCDPTNIKNGGACKDPSNDNCSQTNPLSRCYDKPLIIESPAPAQFYIGK